MHPGGVETMVDAASLREGALSLPQIHRSGGGGGGRPARAASADPHAYSQADFEPDALRSAMAKAKLALDAAPDLVLPPVLSGPGNHNSPLLAARRRPADEW